MSLRVVAVVAVLAWAVPAEAQSVRVEFKAGTVSVSAQNAPLRAILAEWARLGGATIVNGDRLAGPPVTLELTNVTERQALDTLLRNAAGYMLAPRRAGTTGVSAFDRILILPTSTGPRNPPPAAAPTAAGPRPLNLPRPPAAVQPDTAAEEPAPDAQPEAADADPATPVRPTPLGAPRPLIPSTPGPVQPDDTAADEAAAAAPAAAPSTPANPFGIPVGSSALPGVVTPTPRPTPAPQGR